jgi:hypothetical protein
LLASAQLDLPALREGLLAWWAIHGRHSIPWKLGPDQQPAPCGTALDPYSIWVAEAIGPFGMAPADGHHLVLAKGGDHFNLRAPKGEKTVAVLSPVILAWVNGAFAAGPSVAPGPNAPDLLPAKGWGSPTMVLVDVPREKARR